MSQPQSNALFYCHCYPFHKRRCFAVVTGRVRTETPCDSNNAVLVLCGGQAHIARIMIFIRRPVQSIYQRELSRCVMAQLSGPSARFGAQGFSACEREVSAGGQYHFRFRSAIREARRNADHHAACGVFARFAKRPSVILVW